jgi:hypothetical protein
MGRRNLTDIQQTKDRFPAIKILDFEPVKVGKSKIECYLHRLSAAESNIQEILGIESKNSSSFPPDQKLREKRFGHPLYGDICRKVEF